MNKQAYETAVGRVLSKKAVDWSSVWESIKSGSGKAYDALKKNIQENPAAYIGGAGGALIGAGTGAAMKGLKGGAIGGATGALLGALGGAGYKKYKDRKNEEAAAHDALIEADKRRIAEIEEAKEALRYANAQAAKEIEDSKRIAREAADYWRDYEKTHPTQAAAANIYRRTKGSLNRAIDSANRAGNKVYGDVNSALSPILTTGARAAGAGKDILSGVAEALSRPLTK